MRWGSRWGSLWGRPPGFTGPLRGGVAYRAQVPLAGGIDATILTAPTNVLTRNVGNGAMEVSWTAPSGGMPYQYEVWISAAAAGTYEKAATGLIFGTKTIVPNLRFGVKVYTKVRALDKAGVPGPFSSLALDAIAGRARTQLRFTGQLGDIIPEGAVFAALVGDDLVAVKTLEDGELQ